MHDTFRRSLEANLVSHDASISGIQVGVVPNESPTGKTVSQRSVESIGLLNIEFTIHLISCLAIRNSIQKIQ